MAAKTKFPTEKVELFALEYVKDFNASRAALAAGYAESSAANYGYRLSCRPEVQHLVRQHIKRITRNTDLSVQRIVDGLLRNSEAAFEAGDISASNQALTTLARYKKMLTDRVEVFEPGKMTDEELDAKIAERERAIARALGGEGESGSPGESTRTH